MSNNATDPRIKERTIKQHLRHNLTDDEKRELAATMAEKQAELESLEDERKAVASDYKSRIELVQGEIRRSSSTYRQGWELRDIQCSEIYDYNKGTFTIVRLDTGEIVKSRNMTQDELTITLPMEDQAA